MISGVVGTGMENHAKYGEAIYFHNHDTFGSISSFPRAQLAREGLSLRQETRYSESDKVIVG